MANEITIACSISAAKNGASVDGVAGVTRDMTGTEMIGSVQQFSTSETAVSLGGCDQAGNLFIKNLATSGTITIGLDNPITLVLSVIQPGAAILVSGVSTTLYGKSSAGTLDANIVCAET